MALTSETETVIKRLVPYLTRRGYDLDKDLSFEVPTTKSSTGAKGFIDIEVRAGSKEPKFLIEAKRLSRLITAKDINQALDYADSRAVPFVVVTNGEIFRCYNSCTRQLMTWNGSSEKVPARADLNKVINRLKANPNQSAFDLAGDESLPYRPGLPLKQLNRLFYRCHSVIRSIEKNEESAFDDFSKLLFLKLLEEKYSSGDLGKELPYSYRFHILAKIDEKHADQVRDSIRSMLNSIKSDAKFGDVLPDNIRLKNPKTFLRIVKALASVSFQDSGTDSKGAAFEYFVRATLKGKKLGQYFTPRPVVKVMYSMIGNEKILNSIRSSETIRVIDPACGTGGFLVHGMLSAIELARKLRKSNKITAASLSKMETTLRSDVFFGSDANEAVASSAKMNMIVAGDGHSNIRREDSLSKDAEIWSIEPDSAQVVITNPPFGTSESSSLSDEDKAQYIVSGNKGQQLFLQRMISSAASGCDICTVIDDGILNNDSSSELRKFILRKCYLRAIVKLPDVTFKPNKINVSSSILLLERRKEDDVDLISNYEIPYLEIFSLGYEGSGDRIRGWDEEAFLAQFEAAFQSATDVESINVRKFAVPLKEVVLQPNCRLDLRFWDPRLRSVLAAMKGSRFETLGALCKVAPKRGKSPAASSYVDKAEGFAAVVKAGSSISRYGEMLPSEDYLEKDNYEDL